MHKRKCQELVDLKIKYIVDKNDVVHTVPVPPNCWTSYTGLEKTYDSVPAGKTKCKECFERPYSNGLPLNGPKLSGKMA